MEFYIHRENPSRIVLALLQKPFRFRNCLNFINEIPIDDFVAKTKIGGCSNILSLDQKQLQLISNHILGSFESRLHVRVEWIRKE